MFRVAKSGQRLQVYSLQSVWAHKTLDGEYLLFISRTYEGAPKETGRLRMLRQSAGPG